LCNGRPRAILFIQPPPARSMGWTLALWTASRWKPPWLAVE
jgi:hypothetical protein